MKTDSSQDGRQFYIPILFTVITIILGFISFQAVFPDYPFLRKLYYTFQLFTMESGDRFYENGPQSLQVRIIFNLAKYLAVATLILTIVLAILSVLRYRYSLSRVRHMKGHTILCGLGEVGEAVAENFKEKKKLVIIEKDISDENLTELKKAGVRIIEANALDISVLDKIGIENAKTLIALTGDDFNNLTIMNQVLDLLKEKGSDGSSILLTANIDSRNLKVAVNEEWKKERNYPDTELKMNLINVRKAADMIKSQGGFEKASSEFIAEFNRIKNKLLNYNPTRDDYENCRENMGLFNINQLAARYIYHTYPPDRFRSITKDDDPAMNILILGYSKIGEEFFKLCVQNCHYLNRKKTHITIISLEADAVLTKINSVYKKVLDIINIQAINMNPHHLTGKLLSQLDLMKIDVIYICSGEDRYQASYSSRARELYGENIPVVRPFYRNKTWNITNVPKSLHTFNILSNVAKLEDIISEYLDRKAIAVHHHWLKLEISKYIDRLIDCISKNLVLPEPKPTIVPWNLLDEETRDDNRSVVEHINIKLRSVGYLKDPSMYSVPEKEIKDHPLNLFKDKEKVEQLAEMEHRRWMATKYLYGWDYSPKRDLFLRFHESLVDFDQLDENTKDFDRQQIMEMEEIINLK